MSLQAYHSQLLQGSLEMVFKEFSGASQTLWLLTVMLEQSALVGSSSSSHPEA